MNRAKLLLAVATLLLLPPFAQQAAATAGDRLSVYPAVPGLAPSPHYRFRVRELDADRWLTPFAWLTKCADSTPENDASAYYSEAMGGWTHTYCNFEVVAKTWFEVEITRLNPANGQPVAIQQAVPHPRRLVRSWRIEHGKAYVICDQPVLFAVDIDGQMDEHDAPKAKESGTAAEMYPYRNENAFHTVSVFANPFIADKPRTNDPGVFVVPPGAANLPPDDGAWTTLYFAPGVHQLFPEAVWTDGSRMHDYQLRSNRRYYVPGDAIVYGNFNNFVSGEGTNIRFFGHGTLSGERIANANKNMKPRPEDPKRVRLLTVNGGKNAVIEGITMADPPAHTCKIEAEWNTDPAQFNYVRWAKVFSWRGNGDGITVKGSSYLEDCFIRHQDDGSYVRGLGIRRVVYWTDVNGAPLRGSFIGRERNNFPAGMPAGLEKMYVEDIDVIYARRKFADKDFRAVLSSGGWSGNNSSYLVFRNINCEDPRPQRKLFAFDLRDGSRGEEMSDITFQNVRAAAPSVWGVKDSFLGDANCVIKNLVFDNCVLAGKHYAGAEDFQTRAASGFVFQNTAPQTMTFQNTSGYGKWYVHGDWNTGVEPADNDRVKHTAVAAVLVVDAPAYAGSLDLGHADTATLSLQLGGSLKVKDSVAVGVAGRGEIELRDGSLILQGAASGALTVATGRIQIGKGVLWWNGSHLREIQSLYAAGKITLTTGRNSPVPATATLIGEVEPNQLYADFNDGDCGYTRAWVRTP